MLARFIAAILVAAGGTALAQTPPSPAQARELACISDRLVADKVDASIARIYANGDEQGTEYDANIKAMDAAMIACQQQYKWSNDRTNLAAQIAMFQIVLDNFSRALSGSRGVTDAAFDQIGAVLTAMPAADRDILMGGEWREDDALTKRVSDRLIAAGLPSDATVLAFAFLIMEAKLVVTYSTMDWLELKN
jgi:hypothetical protein